MIRTLFNTKKTLFIPFIMGGFPKLDATLQALIDLVSAGADIIELGIPFSDPVADGPINQHAAHQAISQGANIDFILATVRQFRQLGLTTPIILFSYLNPILAFGVEQFAIQSAQAGVNAVLIVDLPPEAGLQIFNQLKQANLEIILLASLTTDYARLPLYQQLDPAFIYFISRLSVTGVQADITFDLELQLRNLQAQLPKQNIAVGFGISTKEQAGTIARFAKAIVIGSVLVSALQSEDSSDFKTVAQSMAQAIEAGATILQPAAVLECFQSN